MLQIEMKVRERGEGVTIHNLIPQSLVLHSLPFAEATSQHLEQANKVSRLLMPRLPMGLPLLAALEHTYKRRKCY